MTNEQLIPVARNVKCQDNRATSDPLFIVQERHRMYGLDPDYCDDTVWIHAAQDCEEADENEAERLDRLSDEGKTDTDWTLTGYVDQWVFVTACFTEIGCQEYIDENRHNLTDPRIYVASAYRNKEFAVIRNHLLEMVT